jgi:type III secretion protein N (ATPase)
MAISRKKSTTSKRKARPRPATTKSTTSDSSGVQNNTDHPHTTAKPKKAKAESATVAPSPHSQAETPYNKRTEATTEGPQPHKADPRVSESPEEAVTNIIRQLSDFRDAVFNTSITQTFGVITSIKSVIITARVPKAKIGLLCAIEETLAKEPLMAEIIAIEKGQCLLTPIGSTQGFSLNASIRVAGDQHFIEANDSLLGCVLDGMGTPFKGNFQSIPDIPKFPVQASSPCPFDRSIIKTNIGTGVRAIDSCLAVGEGQRVGIFAGAGVGKTSLLTMLVKKADFDIIILALIGERGREVREFIEHDLGPDSIHKVVTVVSTSDKPPMERVKSAYVATTVAEYFRDQGKRVLLLIDSLTRFARAVREVALAAGESIPPTGYPPAVFEQLPQLLERAGTNDKGSITAFYTVLVDGDDDVSDPLASEIRSIVDGHIVLSRTLARASHYPAIDVLKSVSRVMNAIVPKDHLQTAEKLRRLMSKYEEIKLLVEIGEYKAGSDKLADEAIQKIDSINEFLRQGPDDFTSLPELINRMKKITG